MTPTSDYDVLVIGSGPAGQKAAIQTAKLGPRVAIIERKPVLGGVSANTGTIPSKTLRAAIVDLTGLTQRSVYGDAYRVKEEIGVDDLLFRVRHVVEHERALVADQLRRNHVELLAGHASFVDPHTLELASAWGRRRVSAAHIVIAVGTRPARPAGVDFDDRTVIDSDGIANLETVSRTMTVVGGGIIGLEYASMAAALGIEVTVVEKRRQLLDFVDAEIVEALQYHLRELRRLPAQRGSVRRRASRRRRRYASAHRQADPLGRRPLRRWPAGRDRKRSASRQPPAVWTAARCPSSCPTGSTHSRRSRWSVEPRSSSRTQPFRMSSAIARYREISRGVIAGDRYGMLKLLVEPGSRQLLGVHVIGTGATEIVHIGQTVMGTGATIDYLIEAVFNYPTFADAYKTAALDAMNRLYALDGSDTALVRRSAA